MFPFYMPRNQSSERLSCKPKPTQLFGQWQRQVLNSGLSTFNTYASFTNQVIITVTEELFSSITFFFSEQNTRGMIIWLSSVHTYIQLVILTTYITSGNLRPCYIEVVVSATPRCCGEQMNKININKCQNACLACGKEGRRDGHIVNAGHIK